MLNRKKSIYGTAANDGKTGNKNQFITENTKANEKKNSKETEDESERDRELEFPTAVFVSYVDDLANSLLFNSLCFFPLCFLFL